MKISFCRQSTPMSLRPRGSIINARADRFTSIGGQDKSLPLPYDPTLPVHEQVLASFQVSLKNLRTTYLDGYILHSPLETIGRTLEAWTTLIQLQNEGKVRMIGVSNTYDIRILNSLCKLRKVQIVQNRWYEGNDWDKHVCSYCLVHGIQYQYAYFFIA